MRAIRRLPVLFVAAVAAAAAPGPAAAADPAPAAAAKGALARLGLSFEAALATRHDDNILQLSQRDIDRLNAQTTPTSRFLISSADDRVTIGDLRARWRTRPLPRRETTVTLDAEVYRYAQNDIKNYRKLGLALAQELSASRKYLSSIRVAVSRIPRFYLRQLTDDDRSFELGRRVRESATYAETDLDVSFEQMVVPDRLEVAVGLERVRRDFNEFFHERDNTNDSSRLRVRGRPLGGSRFQAGVAYVRGALDARGDLDSTPIPDDDISYDHHGFEVTAALPWGGRHAGRIVGRYERERRDFTTTNKFDTLRFDRSETRTDVGLAFSLRLVASLDLIADWRRLRNDAVFPEGVTSDDVTDFTENRWSFGLRYVLK